MTSDPFVIAGRTFASRLIVGTGKYPSHAVMAQAHAASGADMVTVAVRRVNLNDRSGQSLMDFIDRDRMFILPNTAACYTADEAVRTARLGREAGLANWVKLEVIGDEQTLVPDSVALLEATKTLVKEGFVGRVARGGVRQDEHPVAIDEVHERPFRLRGPAAGVEVHAPDRHGHHVGAGRGVRLGHHRVRRVLARADDQARGERAPGDDERVTGHCGSSRS